MSSKLDQLLGNLDCVKQTSDGQWEARCPAHEDHRASLSISSSNGDGKIGVHCHANCATRDVLAALGMKMSDLMPPRASNRKGKIVATYDYHNADGDVEFQVVRFDPKDFRQRRPKVGGGWEWQVKGCKVVPYRLPDLLKHDDLVVYVVEGEKDVDRLRSIPGWDVVATCNAGGAGKWKDEHANYLVRRAVLILPDNDEAGRKHARQVARSLVGKASSVKIVELPGLPDKGDVSDWLDNGGTLEKLVELRGGQDEWQPEQEPKVSNQKPRGGDGDEKKQPSQATLLVEMVDNCDLFSDTAGEAYARFPVGEKPDDLHWEVSRISAKPFRRWLKRRFYTSTGKTPSAQALQDALGVIEAKAIYDGDQRNVFIRVAGHENKIYFDLGGTNWQAVEIDQLGWRVVDDPPVMFRRAKAMLGLPIPAPSGDIQSLRHFANVTDEDWPLLLAVMVAALKPTGPYPVLAVHGEHGSAKSTLCRYIRKIIDPNTSPLRADYREPRDLMICANSGWIVALDNLSVIKDWLSDCLCRLSTGGGFSTRTLYENEEETIFDAKRPVILNCIDEVVTRSDLLDRTVLLNLPRIDRDRRISEADLDRDFDAALPSILGGILTAVSAALRNQGSVNMPELPRMADFAIWATAAESALGLTRGEFMRAYAANRAAGNETALEASPIGKVLVEFVATVGEWSGTSTDLLKELDHRVDDRTRKLDSWPKAARSLGAAVKRLAPNLREAGVGVEFGRSGRSRRIHLNRTSTESCVTNVTDVSDSEKQGFPGDDAVTQNGDGDATPDFDVTTDTPLNPEENGHCDASDDGDAKIPLRSIEPEWCEV
jgi:hypothetical protein